MRNGWEAFSKWRFRKSPAVKRDSTNGSDCLIVVELPFRSASLHFRAYDEPIGTGSVLGCAIQRLRTIVPNGSDVCVLVDRNESHRVECALAKEPGASLWLASGLGQVHDLAALARRTGKGRLLLVDLTAALLPEELFDRLLRIHTARGHQATTVVGLPSAVPPVLIQAELLSNLVRGLPWLPANVLPQDIRAALAGLERAIRAAGWRTRIRVGQVAGLPAAELSRRRWPYSVQLLEHEDVEVLRRVVDRYGDGKGRLERVTAPLDYWTEVAREYDTSRSANFLPHSLVPRNDRSTHRRVLYVQSPSAFSGVEQVLVHLAEGIAAELAPPFEAVALIGLSGTFTDRLAEAGVEVHIAQREFARDSVDDYLYSRHMLKGIRPALVHAHAFTGVTFCCAVAESRIPFVQHVHVASQDRVKQLRNQIRFASAVIAISDFVKQRLIRLGTDPDKIHVIRNGIRLGAAEPTKNPAKNRAVRARTRRECGVMDDAPVVLMPARFVPNKRHDVALDAFARLRATLPGAQLLLAGEAFFGDGPVLEVLETRIDQLRLRNCVHRLGFWARMPDLYAAADVLLLPSEDDPLPLTILEAMAAGVPVVAASSGGIPEMVEHGVSGLLVEPGNPDEFATALVQALTKDECRTRLVANAFDRCRAEFSLSNFVGRVGRLYERLLAGEPVAAGDI